ncbi:MAG TPA: hypothetical protein VJB89_01590 [Candidatus Nanoarchaeia archaeon]|nr:hypothetical protein [Candidatus Nanoarchaeia archaeon]
MQEFKERLSFSFSLLKNKKLWIPDIILVLITLILTFLLVYINNLSHIFNINSFDLIKAEFTKIMNNTPDLIKLMITSLIAILISLLAGISLIATKYTLIKETIANKKFKLKEIIKQSKKFIPGLIKLKICIIILYLIPLLIVGYLAFFKSLELISTLIIILLFLFYSLAFLFIDPILFYGEKRTFKILKQSYLIFKKTPKKTIIILIILGIISLLGISLISLYSYIKEDLTPQLTSTFLIYTFITFHFILRLLITVGTSLTKDIFIFKNYNDIKDLILKNP